MSTPSPTRTIVDPSDSCGGPAGPEAVEGGINRRGFLAAAGAAAAGLALSGARAGGADRDWSGKQPVRYPDPDIVAVDKRFAKYKIGNTPIQRLCTGMLWAEGPAWNVQGRFLIWSDIPNNRQMRWLDDDGHVSVFRQPSGNSNGNTFDREGRQLSCEHGNRRVVRYEHSGALTVLADKWDGKRLNAPNDIVVHPDGAIWFTDPGYGSMVSYEGNKGPLEIKEAIYRIDGTSGKMDLVNDALGKPNVDALGKYEIAYRSINCCEAESGRIWNGR